MGQTYKLENRGLTPPNPMIRTLQQLELMEDDDTLIIFNDRNPMFLYVELDEMGYSYETKPNPEGGFQITILKKKFF